MKPHIVKFSIDQIQAYLDFWLMQPFEVQKHQYILECIQAKQKYYLDDSSI